MRRSFPLKCTRSSCRQSDGRVRGDEQTRCAHLQVLLASSNNVTKAGYSCGFLSWRNSCFDYRLIARVNLLLEVRVREDVVSVEVKYRREDWGAKQVLGIINAQ